MTVEEMLIGVNIGVQKIDSNAYDNILTEEALYYLNKANREYIRRQNVYLKEDLSNVSRSDFITSSEASENLSTLLETVSYEEDDIVESSDYENAKEIDISDLDFFSYVYSQVTTDFFEGPRVCKKISPHEIGIYNKTQYNDPIFRRYPIVKVGSKMIVFFDQEGGDIIKFFLMYIRNPKKLVESNPGSDEVTTTELPPHTHDEIVNIAVGMIMEDIKSIRPYNPEQSSPNKEI